MARIAAVVLGISGISFADYIDLTPTEDREAMLREAQRLAGPQRYVRRIVRIVNDTEDEEIWTETDGWRQEPSG